MRKVAYSTFSIAQIFDDGAVDLVEFDNPPCMFVRNGTLMDLDPFSEVKECAGKTVTESRFTLQPGDILGLVSDGVVYAGVGQALNFGWNWDKFGLAGKNGAEGGFRAETGNLAFPGGEGALP